MWEWWVGLRLSSVTLPHPQPCLQSLKGTPDGNWRAWDQELNTGPEVRESLVKACGEAGLGAGGVAPAACEASLAAQALPEGQWEPGRAAWIVPRGEGGGGWAGQQARG